MMFTSCLLLATESHYAEIEKEALAFICNKFQIFLLGKPFEIKTDHKPLVPLLDRKDLLIVPP